MSHAQPTPEQQRRRGAICTGVGVLGMAVCVVTFAASGYVGSRDEVFGGWIVTTFLGAVASGILASYGQVLRRRASRASRASRAEGDE